VPITYQPPTEKTESFTVSGTGTYTLTEEQRSSRRLSVLVELVRTEDGPPFTAPEGHTDAAPVS